MRKLLLILLPLFVLVSCADKKEYTLQVTPPFQKVDIAYDQFEVDAAEDKVIRLENGGSINIPKDVFVDKNGNSVKGKVKLEYREFQSAADIIASGIPMTYTDENGEVRQMESGGMFDIRGKVNGEEVFIAKGKEIGVNMASKIPGEYDVYYLEEEARPMQAEAGLAFFSNAYGQDAGAEKKKVRWVKLTNKVDNEKAEEEEKEDVNARYYSLQFDTVKFPETKILKDIRWQQAADQKEMNPLEKQNEWVLKEAWEIADISSPERRALLNKEVLHGKINRNFLIETNFLEDTSHVFLQNNYLEIRTWKGERKAVFADTNISYISASSAKTQRVISVMKGGDRVLWSWDGRKIKTLEKVQDIEFLKDGTRIVYIIRDDWFNESCIVADKDGKIITETPLSKIKQVKGAVFQFSSLKVSPDKSCFATWSNEGIRIWNPDGKLLRSGQIPEGMNNSYTHIYFVSYKNALVIEEQGSLPKVWNWQSNKWYTPSIPGELLMTSYHSNAFHPSDPIMIVNTQGFFYIWNWEKNTLKKIGTVENTKTAFVPGGGYIYGYSFSLREGWTIWNEDGKLVSENARHCTFSRDHRNALIFKDGLEWRDDKGNLIKDFRKYDSSIAQGVFRNNDEVVTLSQQGNVCRWNKKGELINSFNIGTENIYLLKATPQYIFAGSRSRVLKAWNYEGKLVCDFGTVGWIIPESKDEKYIVASYDDKIRFWEISEDSLSSNVYQLSLRAKKKSFITYVKLNRNSLSLIEEYNRNKSKKLAEENKRQQKEDALVRSFQIRNFGVYNWDRFYKEENMIAVEPSFDFGDAANAYNNISVFLIVGNMQNTVIKYTPDTYDKFKFDPLVPNQLIAVLPDDRIALFTRKEFEKLNAEEFKKNPKYTFKMKVLDKVESVEALDRLLKPPV